MKPIYKNIKERFLFLYITEKCNLRYKHCYLGSEKIDRGREMSLSQIDSILGYFKATSGHDKLYIIGGEPTLHPKLDEIIDMGNKKGYSITISTNGLFDKELFNILTSERISSLNISLDSSEPAQFGEIRSTSKEKFHKVIANIKRSVEKGLQVRVMYTVSNINSENALDMINFLEEIGVRTLSYHNLGMTGNATNFLKPLSPREWIKFCNKIENHPPTKKMAVYYPPTFVKKENLQKYVKRGYPGCTGRTLDRPHVLPGGEIYFCPLFMDYNVYGATFKNKSLKFNSKKNSELNLYYKQKEKCMECKFNNLCLGGCPAYDYIDDYEDFFNCDQDIIPLCILWTTYAWDKKPSSSIHDFR